MAEETAPEVVDPNTPTAAAAAAAATTIVDMDIESGAELNQKREREEEGSQDDAVSKKQKVDEEKSAEEQRLEKVEEQKENNGEEKENEEEKEVEGKENETEASVPDPVNLGFKSFTSSVGIFNYFYNILHVWPESLNINKYEHVMLLELLKKGHAEPDRKIGVGIRAFQVRKHPAFKSRCFFLIREDSSVDDFSFRKCVGNILPLPEEKFLKPDVNKGRGGGGGGKHHGGKGGRGKGGRGGGDGHGRGGKRRY